MFPVTIIPVVVGWIGGFEPLDRNAWTAIDRPPTAPDHDIAGLGINGRGRRNDGRILRVGIEANLSDVAEEMNCCNRCCAGLLRDAGDYWVAHVSVWCESLRLLCREHSRERMLGARVLTARSALRLCSVPRVVT